MPIVYKITTILGKPSVPTWPPQIEESNFYINLENKMTFKYDSKFKPNIITKSSTIIVNNDTILPYFKETIEGKKVVRFLWFDTEEEFESWITENRLTDPYLLSVLQEWSDAYDLKIIEEYYRVSEYSPNIAGLFN
jgi:hypothetical protein